MKITKISFEDNGTGFVVFTLDPAVEAEHTAREPRATVAKVDADKLQNLLPEGAPADRALEELLKRMPEARSAEAAPALARISELRAAIVTEASALIEALPDNPVAARSAAARLKK